MMGDAADDAFDNWLRYEFNNSQLSAEQQKKRQRKAAKNYRRDLRRDTRQKMSKLGAALNKMDAIAAAFKPKKG